MDPVLKLFRYVMTPKVVAFVDVYPQSAGEDQAELKAYDAKVYKASTEMAEALVFELKALGIPFFSIRESYVCDTPKDEPREAALSSDELAMLQRRMLELLQDLCRE